MKKESCETEQKNMKKKEGKVGVDNWKGNGERRVIDGGSQFERKEKEKEGIKKKI
jgi:hypothetical protein